MNLRIKNQSLKFYTKVKRFYSTIYFKIEQIIINKMQIILNKKFQTFYLIY